MKDSERIQADYYLNVKDFTGCRCVKGIGSEGYARWQVPGL